MSLKAKIEAILFLTEKPLRAQAIAGIVGEEVQLVRQSLLELIHDYEERQGGLEIADEDGYSFQVRDQYANMMDEFLPIEMSAAQLRTLSAIAIKQPIPQSEIIRIRGAGAYDHIKELVLRGLISKREDEKTRSPLLSTTKQFQEYFRLTKDGKSLRSYLKKEMKKKDKVDDLAVAAANGQLVEDHTSVAAEDIQPNDLSFEPGAVTLASELDQNTLVQVSPENAAIIASTEQPGTASDPSTSQTEPVNAEPDPIVVIAEQGTAEQNLTIAVVEKVTAEPDPTIEIAEQVTAEADAIIAKAEQLIADPEQSDSGEDELDQDFSKVDPVPNSVPDPIISMSASNTNLSSFAKESLPTMEIAIDKPETDPLPKITLEQHTFELQVPMEASDSNNENSN